MPKVVKKWEFFKNVSCESRKEVNKGCNYILKVYVADENAL